MKNAQKFLEWTDKIGLMLVSKYTVQSDINIIIKHVCGVVTVSIKHVTEGSARD